MREARESKINKQQEGNIQLAMICTQFIDESVQPSLCSVEVQREKTELPATITTLLSDYSDIFVEPKTLPPFRAYHDHKIPFLEGSNPIKQWPYRYAMYQKNEIDKMVKELLDAKTIQNSSSPYASQMVLVKKKDGSWRLCVDYRGLNGMTVNDRFSIPLIEYLMDEPGGSKVYSKIDLRADYYQVKMHPADIRKTAFKTHSGHYEYIVMPFELTNAPATFQRLMNAVFKKLLRKSVLIFLMIF